MKNSYRLFMILAAFWAMSFAAQAQFHVVKCSSTNGAISFQVMSGKQYAAMGQRLRAENVSLRRAHAEAQKVWEKDESREDLYPGRKLTARKMMKVRTSPNEEAANEVLEKEETKQTGKEERSEKKAAEKRKKKLEGKEGKAKKRAEKRQKQEEAFAELLEEARPMLEAEIEKIVSGMPGMDKIENIPW